MKPRTTLLRLLVYLPCACGNGETASRAPEQHDPPNVPVLETCNFADDDGDGVVDEGFAWVIEPAKVVHRVGRFSSVGPAAASGDATWLVAGTDAVSEPDDQLFVLRVDAGGNVVAGPAHVTIPYCSQGSAVVAPWGSKAVGMVGTRTWPGREPCPAEGCPLLITVFAPDLAPERTAHASIAALPDVGVTGLSCTAGACFAVVGSGAQTGLVKISTETFAEQAYQPLGVRAHLLRPPEPNDSSLEVVFVENDAVRWERLDADDLSIQHSRLLLEEATNIFAVSRSPDGGFTLTCYDVEGAPMVARFDVDLQLLHGPVEAAAPFAMTATGGSLLYAAQAPGGFGATAQITRLTSS
ncbi:MAG: hypothetical protein ACOC1F_10685, partial [Myxococcota bacterium]